MTLNGDPVESLHRLLALHGSDVNPWELEAEKDRAQATDQEMERVATIRTNGVLLDAA